MSKKPQAIDRVTLLAVASIIAIGGVIYELMLSTATSHLIGDSTKSYSLGIGLSLFGMGIGSLIVTRFFRRPLISFMTTELLLSVVGGVSIIVLYAAFSLTSLYWLVFVVLSIAIGVLIGFEIPLVVETYRNIRNDSNVFLSRILGADYIGALVGSILFPFILLPYLGLVRSALIMGLINLSVVILLITRSRKNVNYQLTAGALFAFVFLIGLLAASNSIERGLTTKQYQDEVVYFQTTQYQKIVMTKRQDDVRLYLNDQLQFSSRDEARYHETLVHSAMIKADNIRQVLILGGGDGMAAREALKYPKVEKITNIDLDPVMTNLARDNWQITQINDHSFSNPKVEVINRDAEQFVRNTTNRYDVVIVDLVDPANEKIARLFSADFYREVSAVLSPGGVFITQATSSYFTPNAFWAIHNNTEEVFGTVSDQTVNIPSFGEWGFVSSTPLSTTPKRNLPGNLQYLTKETLSQSRILSKELLTAKHNITSTVLSPKLHTLYNNDMSRWSY